MPNTIIRLIKNENNLHCWIFMMIQQLRLNQKSRLIQLCINRKEREKHTSSIYDILMAYIKSKIPCLIKL